MDQDELVKRLHLKEKAQLDDLLKKFREFLSRLDEDQLKVVRRSLPSLWEALAWLGPHATEAELRELFGAGGHYADGEPIMVCHFAGTDRIS
jgi:hypothetical protein